VSPLSGRGDSPVVVIGGGGGVRRCRGSGPGHVRPVRRAGRLRGRHHPDPARTGARVPLHGAGVPPAGDPAGHGAHRVPGAGRGAHRRRRHRTRPRAGRRCGGGVPGARRRRGGPGGTGDIARRPAAPHRGDDRRTYGRTRLPPPGAGGDRRTHRARRGGVLGGGGRRRGLVRRPAPPAGAAAAAAGRQGLQLLAEVGSSAGPPDVPRRQAHRGVTHRRHDPRGRHDGAQRQQPTPRLATRRRDSHAPAATTSAPGTTTPTT